MKTHKCLICLDNIEIDKISGNPTNAVIITSHGNYGSSIFDPLYGVFARAYICDNCLRDNSDIIEVVNKAYTFKEEIVSLDEYLGDVEYTEKDNE